MMTSDEYRESLRRLSPRVYAFGELLGSVVDHPLTRPHVEAAAATYDIAWDPDCVNLATADSPLLGRKVNRFTHIHGSVADLVNKVKLLRALGRRTGTCFQRCVGLDALNALHGVTHEMDARLGTSYHARLMSFVRSVQENDLMCAGSMTDPKGDRSRRPSQQEDPDMFVRVIEEIPGGIVLRGAKMHQTGIVNSHEMIILPTLGLREEEAAYAVACAVPVDAPGVTHILGRQTNDLRKLEENCLDMGNSRFGVVGGEALTILDGVFVPWERVFMCGEHAFSSTLVERFASYHRQNYGGCKVGVADVIIGAAWLAADYHGLASTWHIRDKLAEMVHLSETLYAGSIACSAEGSPLPGGCYYVDALLANTVKHNVTRFIYEICRLAQDIAGGYLATMPSEKDLRSAQVGMYVEKYLKGRAGVGAEDRMRIGRLLENMTGGTALLEAMHGAGSPQAQRIMILRQADLSAKAELAKRLAGISGRDE